MKEALLKAKDKVVTLFKEHPITTFCGIMAFLCGNLATVEQLASYSSVLNFSAVTFTALIGFFASDGKENNVEKTD